MLRCICSVESWACRRLSDSMFEVMQHYVLTVPGQPQLCQQIFLEINYWIECQVNPSPVSVLFPYWRCKSRVDCPSSLMRV